MKEIEKGYMSFAEGFLGPKFVGESKQLYWNEVKAFIAINRNSITSVDVGLAEDWNCTSGEIWNKDQGYLDKEDVYAYVSSVWAIPAMCVYYNDGTEKTIECWEPGDNAKNFLLDEIR